MSIFRIIPIFLAAACLHAAPQTPEQRIDALVNSHLERQGITPNADIDDSTFLRRAYLNIGGRIPTIEEAEAFHASPYPNKRERLIESLLNSEAYVSHFYHFWADLLRVNEENGATGDAYQLWLKQSLRENTPYDQFVRELVTARGEFWDNGATRILLPRSWHAARQHEQTPSEFSSAPAWNAPSATIIPSINGPRWTTSKWLPSPMACPPRTTRADNRTMAGKHLKAKSMEDYMKVVKEESGLDYFPYITNEKSMEKFLSNERKSKLFFETSGLSEKQFRRIIEKGMAAAGNLEQQREGYKLALNQIYNPLKYISVSERDATLKLPHDYQYSDASPHDPVTAATMFGEEIDLSRTDDQIEAYASWMTSRDNPTFTRVVANRLWKEAFGLGIIEPVDELTDQSVASNPELMAYLEDLMRELDYDMKRFLKIVLQHQGLAACLQQ